MKQELLASWALAWQQFGGIALAGLRIIGILFMAWLAIRVSQRSNRAACAHRDALRRPRIRQARRDAWVFRYIAAVVITLIAGMLVLGELGVSVAPILGAADVVGLAVGFGAQSLVKDYFNGFFLLLENQIRQGDVV